MEHAGLNKVGHYCAFALCLTGCAPDGSEGVGELASSANEVPSSTSDDSPANSGEQSTQTFRPFGRDDFDFLLIVDSSESMAEEAALLSENIRRIAAVLEDENVQANYRIAITSNDAGNPFFGLCPNSETDQAGIAGRFMESSCLDRIDDFETPDGLDLSYAACKKNCKYTTQELGLEPIFDDETGNQVRPWLQSFDGKTNFSSSLSLEDAIACLAPVGLKGCEYEQPLQSQHMAIERMFDPETKEFGFRRPNTPLVIMYVSDEADCSVADPSIFDPNGKKAFWNSDSELTSAACWRAGVQCSEGEAGAMDCEPTNKDAGGQPTDSKDAVLHPLSKFIRQIEELSEGLNENQRFNTEVMPILIGGVEGNGRHASIEYEDVSKSNPDFHLQYGIGPGCESTYAPPSGPYEASESLSEGQQFAIPPVRLREFVEHFNEDRFYSICEPDYSPSLGFMSKKLGLAPENLYNFEGRVADQHPETRALKPQCSLRTHPINQSGIVGHEVEIPECLKSNKSSGFLEYEVDADGFHTVPEGFSSCYQIRFDRDLSTPSLKDDVIGSLPVFSDSANLQVQVHRKRGTWIHPGQEVVISCRLSTDPEKDCTR